jgi:hypothetical protein
MTALPQGFVLDQAAQPDYGSVIASIESGGKYDILGPVTKTGDRAYGKYQIMGANIGPWSQEALGRKLTAQEFLADPQSQDAVFQHRFNQYVSKYGPEGASKAWFAGEKGMNNPNAKDQLGTTVEKYGRRFMSALGGHSSAAAAPQEQRNAVVTQPDGANMPGGLPPGFALDGNPGEFTVDPTFSQRFGGMQPPANAPALQDELERAGRLARGEPSNKYSYGAVYPEMVRGAVDTMSSGARQAREGDGFYEKAKGAGAAAIGGLQYVGAPINAAARVLVGNPVEKLTGIPRDYTEFAATLATPGIGLPGITRAGNVASKIKPPTSEELLGTFKQAKHAPEVEAVVINPQSAVKFATKVDADLQKEWFRPNNQRQVFSILDELKNPPQGAKLTMADVDAARRRFGELAGKFGSDESAAATIAKRQLDDWMDNIKPADVIAGDVGAAQTIMREARANYSAGKLGQSLDKRVAKAEMNASTANSGLNLQNQLRTQAKNFLNSADSRSLTASERKLMERFVKGTATQNVIRWASNVLGGGGGLGTAVVGLGGMATAGAAGAALPLAGYALKAVGNSLTARQAEKLSEVLRSRSPLAKQQKAALEQWAKYAEAAQSSPPTPRAIALLTIQSRNLANNLKDAGIVVKPEELMRSITAHPGTRADENNN